MSALALKSNEFRREREALWGELERLLGLVEKSGHEALSSDELYRLPSLYRAVLSSLAVARSISLDKNLLGYLEGLSARAYLCVYARKRPFWIAVRGFFGGYFSSLVHRNGRLLLLAISFLFLGTLVGYLLTMDTPDRFYSFVGEGMASGRSPSSSREELLSVLKVEETQKDTLSNFASFLFTHNAQIGLLCFALGVLVGVPVIYLLFTNGLTLGAFWAIYAQKGLQLEFWAWILPHGVTELLAVALSGQAGFMIAQAMIFPGRYSRVENLMLQGRKAASMMAGAVGLFFIAALLEGFFRQLVTSEPPRYAVVALTFIFWCWYFGRAPKSVEAR